VSLAHVIFLAFSLPLLSGCIATKQSLNLETQDINANVAAVEEKQQPVPDPFIEKKLNIVEAARSNIGVRYRFGGSSPQTGFDCSGLVSWSYQQVGVTLPRRAREQLTFGVKVDDKSQLLPGDIVVFRRTSSRTGWHSGIYTGDGKFIHSPRRGKTVTETKLGQAYFAQRFAGARRIPRDDRHTNPVPEGGWTEPDLNIATTAAPAEAIVPPVATAAADEITVVKDEAIVAEVEASDELVAAPESRPVNPILVFFRKKARSSGDSEQFDNDKPQQPTS